MNESKVSHSNEVETTNVSQADLEYHLFYDQKYTAIFDAMLQDDENLVFELIEKNKVDTNNVIIYGIHNNKTQMTIAIDTKYPYKLSQVKKKTPLMIAASQSNEQLVKHFIRMMGIKDHGGMKALDYALFNQNSTIIQELLKDENDHPEEDDQVALLIKQKKQQQAEQK